MSITQFAISNVHQEQKKHMIRLGYGILVGVLDAVQGGGG